MIKSDAGMECSHISITKEHVFQWHNLLSRMSPLEAKSNTKVRGMYSLSPQTISCVLAPYSPSIFDRNQGLHLWERVVCLSFVGDL